MYLITSLTMVSNITWNVVNKSDRRRSGKWVATAVKGFTLFISNEDVNDIIKIIKWLEDSGLLIDGVTKTVKGEIKKKQEGGCLDACWAPFDTLLVQLVASSVVKGISRRGDRRAWGG